MRRTKIVCTIGPASESEDMLRRLALAGMNVARFNFSHGTHEEHRVKFERLKKIRQELELPIAAMLDTKGPEIRLRDFRGGAVTLTAGQTFTLTTEDILGDEHRASVTWEELPRDCTPGHAILIDDGLIELRIDDIDGTEIHCTVMNGGPVSNHKGVNVPGSSLSMPYISEQDKADLIFGARLGFDFVAASFVRSADDIRAIRALLDKYGSKARIIAKIENHQGIRNIREIIRAADGVMVARGDMGVEIPLEEVPVMQKRIIKLANQMGKYVITATQMLDSMMHNPRPTRAETADVANAIYDGTTAVMLSGESAAGQYPEQAVDIMSRIAARTETDINYTARLMKIDDREEGRHVTTAISHATCSIAAELQADAIITVTMSGYTAAMVSRYKPSCPIIACSTDPMVVRQLNLMWGVSPLLVKSAESETQLFREALKKTMAAGLIRSGQRVVLTAGLPLGTSGTTNMVRVIDVK